MSVTLRLEGLSKRAHSYDIRKFFVGLDIPQGGVQIIGGPDGEAFVDVATWDNAYQALQMSGLQIKDSIINISVVSSEEKQLALENSNKVKDSSHGRNGTDEKKGNEQRDARSRRKLFYLRMEISDFEPTLTDIRHFFDGLYIRDTVFSKDKDSAGKVVAIIMFENKDDATEGYNRYKDSKVIHITQASESEWIQYGGKTDYDEDDTISSISGNSKKRTHPRSPRRRSRSPRRRSRSRSPQKHSRSSRRRSRSPRRDTRSPQRYNRSSRRHSKSPQRNSRSPQRSNRSPQRYTRSPRRNTRSPQRYTRSPRRDTRSPRRDTKSPRSSSRTPVSYSKSAPCQSEEQDLTNPEEYHVRFTNLSHRAKRKDLKRLFDYQVRDDHLVIVHDDNSKNTQRGFVTFTSKEHYTKAIKLNRVMFKGRNLSIAPISKSNMQRILRKNGYLNGCFQVYLYVKNLPPDVTKSDVKDLFVGFSLYEDDIFLLLDKKNTCLGDVLVRFSSIEVMARAKLNLTTFKDKPIEVKAVYWNNLKSFLHENGLHMKAIDPNECVTQEDDPSEDETPQDNDACDDEPIVQDADTPEDDCAAQKDALPECVSQADD